jgi:hypothetical protein
MIGVTRNRLAVVALALSCAGASFGQGEPPAPERAEDAPPERSGEALPSLDDLLGIPTEEKPPAEDAGHDSALERALSDQEVSDAFRQAVTEMRDVAALLENRDPGVRAQRMQEEIILKLDMLIEQAQQQQQQSSSSSSSSQQQQQQSPTRNQQRAQQQAQSSGQGDNRSEQLPPGGREGALGELIQSSGAEWGSLPARVREALLQGSSDRFSSLYESLTEAYFRRLAEESTDR